MCSIPHLQALSAIPGQAPMPHSVRPVRGPPSLLHFPVMPRQPLPDALALLVPLNPRGLPPLMPRSELLAALGRAYRDWLLRFAQAIRRQERAALKEP